MNIIQRIKGYLWPKPIETGEYLFVYGTLKRGFRLNDCLHDCEYAGEGTAIGLLYDLGPFPGLRLEGDATVQGELYRLPEGNDRLRRLDQVEGYHVHKPESSLYLRKSIPVKMDDGTTKQAWCYEFNQDLREASVVKNGEWIKGRTI